MNSMPTDPKTFFQSPDAVACVVDRDALFGLLTRSFEVPPDQVALVTRPRGDRIVESAGATLAADDVQEILLLRTAPRSLTFDDLKVGSLDRFQCAASASFQVSCVPEVSELRSFQSTVLGGERTARVSTLADYFRAHVSAALALAAEGRGVGVLIDSKNAEMLAGEVADTLKGAAFNAGLRIEASVQVTFDSPTYRQLRRDRADAKRRREEFAVRHRLERAVETAQQRHTEHLAELLSKLQSLAADSPGNDVADLVRTFPETERGELYGALFGADDERAVTGAIAVASGGEVVFYSPDSQESPLKRVAMPSEIGPLRSVNVFLDADDRRRLLVGGASGLCELAAGGDGEMTTYVADAPKEIKGGVNSAALVGDRVFASHSELGLLYWPRGGGSPATLATDRTEGAQAVRAVCFLNGDIYFSVNDAVIKLPADALDAEPTVLTGSRYVITSLCPTVTGLYAGNAEGHILFWPDDSTDQPETLHTGRRRSAESIAVLDFGGLKRLFFTDTSLAVFARVLGDTFTCRYEAGGQTLRRAEVAPDLIVATNDIRDRLIFWKPGRPAEPHAVVPVARMTGHSVQDVCLIPRV